MRLYKTQVLLLAVFGPALVLAQIRELGTLQASEPRTPDASVSAAGFTSSTRNPLSTAITGTGTALGAGDLLEITVFDTPELTQRMRVDDRGDILLALIGEIHVQGMSPDELQRMVRQKLIDGHFVKNPQVSVFVAEYAGQMAYLTGEVNRPGAYPLLRAHRLADLISVAGGLSASSGNDVTIRREGSASSSIHVDLSDKDEERSNPEIKPGDDITVGKTGIVYVLGDVTRPGGFLIDRRSTLSVMQAIALAEGTTQSASITKVQVIRTENGVRKEIPLNLKTMLKSQSSDMLVQANDVIFVPGSMTRGIGRRSIDAILATATSAAIYANHP
jgi:polysaccharide export outer membrane protein